MNRFNQLNTNEPELNNKLANALKAIGVGICKKYLVDLSDINYEKVVFDNDTWININFVVDCIDQNQLSKLNIELSKELAKYTEFLNSDIEYIPSFTQGEIKCQSHTMNSCAPQKYL